MNANTCIDSPLMVGMDLHRNNVVFGMVDHAGNRLKQKKLPCNLDSITQWLEPHRSRLQTIAIESTFNWYWLVDGLRDRGFEVVLANPAQIVQYDGIKHADDANDAYFLAGLLRLDILPTGHIYDREIRPTRARGAGSALKRLIPLQILQSQKLNGSNHLHQSPKRSHNRFSKATLQNKVGALLVFARNRGGCSRIKRLVFKLLWYFMRGKGRQSSWVWRKH